MTNQKTLSTALTVRDLEKTQTAGQVFRKALAGKAEEKSQALMLLSNHPEHALQALQSGREDTLELTEKGQHDILEVILDGVGREKAQDFLSPDRGYLTSERLAEIVGGGGDLPSTAAAYAPLNAVLMAVLADIGEALKNGQLAIGALFHLQAWALKLKDRSDYQDFLSYTLGELSIREWLILAVWLSNSSKFDDANDDDNTEENSFRSLDVSPEALENLGIATDGEELVRMHELAENFEHPSLDEIEDAKRDLANWHETTEKAPQFQTTEAVERAASKLNI